MAGTRGPLDENTSVELAGNVKEVPEPPAEVTPATIHAWNEYWTSGVARAADYVDIPVLRRLFAYRDEWQRLSDAYNALPISERTVAGSRNQDAEQMHPYTKRMRQLEADMAKIEAQFGLTPMSRARLGIEIGQQQLTWGEVQKRQREQSGELPTPKQSGLPVAGVEE